jgi:molybdopterin molybdotransferase
MPSFEEARRLILDSITPLASERVELLESLGRVTAEDIVAPWNLPSCDNAAMDGYAVRGDDCQQPANLRVTGFLPAGAVAAGSVDAGCAIKIMTGAPIPPGGDTVVPFEDTEECGNQVQITAPVVRGQHIRLVGEDVRCGETVIAAGRVIRAAEIGMLASCGRALVSVHRKPTVAILSTGDELLRPGVWRDAGDAWDCSRQPCQSCAKNVRRAQGGCLHYFSGSIRRRTRFGAGGAC